MSSTMRDFRKFIMRGNIVDMAIGVAIGTSFTAIANSMVNDIIIPFVNGLFGGDGLTQLSIQFRGAAITYGNFLQAILNFLLIALVVFFVIRFAIRVGESMGVEAGEMGLAGIIPDSAHEKQPSPAPDPKEVVLLAEIRDLLQAQA